MRPWRATSPLSCDPSKIQYPKGQYREITWTKYAEERQKEWHKKLGITREEVEELLRNPTQIVSGDLEAFVAQTKRGNGLLRAVFVELQDERKLLTVYWTSKIAKYWKEE
ncbi:MAG: DUF4258 domain-containing protein [Chloroflexi bacterium]|nr:DUF4258 domain-containing protein [Chloroflexota bacterium]